MTKERTLHIIMHYISGMSLEQIRQQIDMFSQKNMNWIRKVGVSTFNKLSLSPSDYVDRLVEGTVDLDGLALLIAARACNIHVIVLCKERYWSTRADKLHEDCEVKLAFSGVHSFKELTSKVAEDFDKSFEEDLQGTGLADSDTHSGSACSQCDGSCNCSDPSDKTSSPSDAEDATDGDDATSIISLSSGDALDLSHSATATVKTEPTDETTKQSVHRSVTDTASTSLQGNLTDVIPFQTKCIERKDPYRCHVCLMVFELQSSYVKHMKEDHQDEALQCDKYNASYASPNGLFKHIRSHRYMKYKCDLCKRHFQFPYQINDHLKTHTGSNLYPCNNCNKKFASRSSAKAHEKSHDVELKCPACPDMTTKRYHSQVSLNIHSCGMHSEGWYAPCGKSCKWKSMYARHIKKCKVCIKKIVDFWLNRYDFMNYIALDTGSDRD